MLKNLNISSEFSCWKFLNNFLPVNFECYFRSISNIHSHSTRSSKTNFFLHRFKSSNGQKLLAYQGSKLWTDLPIKLKDQSHLGKFQVELKNSLIDNQLIT